MTLTEQWKKGKLPEGDYYIKRRNGYLLYDNIDSHGVWRNSIDEDIVEVLSPVPSYDDWVYLHKARNVAHEIVKSLTQENAQLRKFLEEFNALDVAKENQQLKDVISKMCMELVDPDDDMSNGLAEYFNQDLLLEIHEVLK